MIYSVVLDKPWTKSVFIFEPMSRPFFRKGRAQTAMLTQEEFKKKNLRMRPFSSQKHNLSQVQNAVPDTHRFRTCLLGSKAYFNAPERTL